MKPTTKRLTLDKQTIRALLDRDLETVRGGYERCDDAPTKAENCPTSGRPMHCNTSG